MVVSTSRVLPWSWPVSSLRAASSDGLLGRTERDGTVADLLGADQAAEQGEPAGEHDRRAALDFGCVERVPACAEGSERERVDPGRQALADRDRLDAEGSAQGFVLVLGVAQDEGPVAEAHHPQAERLDRGRLAHAGLAEGEQVRVADTGMSGSSTQPFGSAKNDAREK